MREMCYIERAADALVRKYKTRDPFEICEALNVAVSVSDIGKLRGFYTHILRNRFIVVGAWQDSVMRAIVCAHELGHDRLHRELASKTPFREYSLWRADSRPEYEANLFAATILIDERELLSAVRGGDDLHSVAASLGTDENLVAVKLAALRDRGIRVSTIETRSDFLKNTQ